MVDNVTILPGLGKSDHCIIAFDFSCYTQYSQTGPQRLIYFKGDYVAFGERLKDCDRNDS